MSTRTSRPASRRSTLSPATILLSAATLIANTGSAVAGIEDLTPEDAVQVEHRTCDNEHLTGFDSLLVIAPHPDDEVLGFSGLINAYLEQGKPVEVIVSTDGDAYCGACQFWKNGSSDGAMCDALDFSNFTTPEIDSFAEIRREESRGALEILGVGTPTFLGYPDTGLAAAWANLGNNDLQRPLRRSDFSSCEECGTCDSGYGSGPETELSAATLIETLRGKMAETTPETLLATTHWLDGHGDHAALGELVKQINGELTKPRTVAVTVIHAYTAKETAYADCWYPGPEARICPCADEERALAEPTWLADLRRERFHPDWPATLPDDADYGKEVQLCLPDGFQTTKQEAIESFASQLGFLARNGELQPELRGLTDCTGYLLSFVRTSEAFTLIEPETTS